MYRTERSAKELERIFSAPLHLKLDIETELTNLCIDIIQVRVEVFFYFFLFLFFFKDIRQGKRHNMYYYYPKRLHALGNVTRTFFVSPTETIQLLFTTDARLVQIIFSPQNTFFTAHLFTLPL
jgi:hypothetical protein